MDEQPGFKITLKDVYDEVKGLRSDWDMRIRKLEVQIAAQWVIIGIVIAGVTSAFAQFFSA